jgi:hypothetical protein
MSTKIYWTPVLPKEETVFQTSSPRHFIRVMRNAFYHQHEWVVKKEDIEKLYGMMAASDDDSSKEFEELLRIAEQYGEVKIWAKY